MNTSETFQVYRAKLADAAAIADFVARATHGRVSIEPQAVIERFGIKGLSLVKQDDGEIVGLIGWRAENLVARVDDFLVFPPELYPTAGRALLENMEEAAQELKCEVSMLFVPSRAAPTLVAFYESCGYSRPDPEEMPRVWKETAQEAAEQDRHVMTKQLRSDLVVRPM